MSNIIIGKIVCSKCLKEKPLEYVAYFPIPLASWYGHICKECAVLLKLDSRNKVRKLKDESK
jgi:hypothetical protein